MDKKRIRGKNVGNLRIVKKQERIKRCCRTEATDLSKVSKNALDGSARGDVSKGF